MRNIYTRILGEDFMNSPVQGTKEEAKFIEQKLNEFRKKQEMDINILKKIKGLCKIKMNISGCPIMPLGG